MEKDVEKKRVFGVAFSVRFGYDVLMMFTDDTAARAASECEGGRDHPWHEVYCPACNRPSRSEGFDPDDYMM